MIVFTCPACQQPLSVHDHLGGKRARCPHCGTAASIPPRDAPTLPPARPANGAAAETLPPSPAVDPAAPAAPAEAATLPPAGTESRLTELLSVWQRAWAQGVDLPAAELCQSCPELVLELDSRLQAVRQVEGLARGLHEPAPADPYPTRPPLAPPAAYSDVPGGPKVAGYEILGELGRGGMGVVYKARHRHLDRVVALKFIRSHLLEDPDAARRFRREARAAAQLHHPHLIFLYDADEADGTHFLAMEYVEGIDLARLVEKGSPLPPDRACEYVRQAALGLQHAFEKGLVHRDIKPANLLLASTTGDVKILDMGLARLGEPAEGGPSLSSLTRVGAVMGTPDFMAPEQALNAHTVDIRADVYSLGCTLYFLLTGRPPFDGGMLPQKLIRHQQEEAPALRGACPQAPEELERVVRKLLAKKPEDRYQTPAEVAEALAPFCGPAPATLVLPGARAGRAGPGWLPWLVGAAGLACSFLLGFFVAPREDSPETGRPPAPDRVGVREKADDRPPPFPEEVPVAKEEEEPGMGKEHKALSPLVGVAGVLKFLPAGGGFSPPSRDDWPYGKNGVRLCFSFEPVPKGPYGMVRELRLRPHVRTQVFLHVFNPNELPAEDYTVELLDGGTVAARTTVKVVKGKLTPVRFGTPPPPPRDGKSAPLPLTEAKGSLTVRLLSGKKGVDGALIRVASPQEYVKVDPPSFERMHPKNGTENGKAGREGVFEIRLNAANTFRGPPARVELVLTPERIPDLVPEQRRYGSYGGDLVPGVPLVLRAERLKFKEGKLGRGLFSLTIDGYPRAFIYVSSLVADKKASQPQEVTAPVLRLVHPPFLKPGARLQVVLEADNLPPEDERGSLVLLRGVEDDKGTVKQLTGREGLPRSFYGARVGQILFSPKGPGGSLVFDSKVADHNLIFDTADLYGPRYLVASLLARAEGEAQPRTVLNSRLIPEFGQDLKKAGVTFIGERVLLHEARAEDFTLAVNLPATPDGRRPRLKAGTPLPLKVASRDPTGVVKVVFFSGQLPEDGKIPPTAPQAEGAPLPGRPNVWATELSVPTDKWTTIPLHARITNGTGQAVTRSIGLQLVGPKAPLGGGSPAPAGTRTLKVELVAP